METLLTGRVVVVVGGAGRLGRAFSAAIAASGGLAVVADLDKDAAAATANLTSTAGGRAEPALVDVADAASVNTLVRDVSKRHGRIDAVVCTFYPRSAIYGRTFDAVDYADFSEHLRLHVGGYFHVAQRFGAFFEQQGHGHIINVASIYGVLAPRFEIYQGTAMTVPIEYATAKAAILQMTKYLAKYYKGRNIRVNALTPGGILDGQAVSFLERYNANCLGKGMLDAGDLTGSLLFLLSDMSAHVNGQNLIVDDGFTL
jgi:NAD(P)-dependent dehydrogenase (short-subunit alcohol dehydrogenase family)